MTIRACALVFAMVAAVLVSSTAAVAKGKKKPQSCEEARLAAGGGFAKRLLKCEAAAAAGGKSASTLCLALAQARAFLPISKFDSSGACLIDPRTAAMLAQVDGAVRDVVTLLRPTPGRSACAAKKLKAVGAAASRLMTIRAQLTRAFDAATLTSAVAGANGEIEQRFAAAERRSCATTGDASAAARLVGQLAGVAGSLAGRIVLAKTVAFPQAAWSEVVAGAATFEASGFSVAMDGSSITGMSQPAGGWLVVLGEQRARTDADGEFRLDVAPGSPVEGQLFHPSNPTQAMARFFVTELGPDDTPAQLDVELVTQGRCGMNVNPADDSVQCAAPSAVQTPPGHFHAEPAVLNPDPALYPPMIDGELGTYPNPDPAAAQVACLDYNGLIETGERGDSSLMGAVSYPGSTCHYQVEIGCCDNEAATIRRRIANLFDEQRFPVLGCVFNHFGRLCQQIQSGDIAARSKGALARAEQEAHVYVVPAEKPPVDVHNNGCYGRTNVTVRVNEVGGVLVGTGFDGATLEHHDGTPIEPPIPHAGYFVDRHIAYWAPVECPDDPDAVDVFEFETDGKTATLIFHCPGQCPPPPGRMYTCPTTTTTTLP